MAVELISHARSPRPKLDCDCRGSVPSQEDLKVRLATAESFADLCTLVRNCDTTLSFFGSKNVSIKDGPGTVTIDDLVARVFELLQKYPHFNSADRKHGVRIAKHINALYSTSKVQEYDANRLTKLICMIRNCIRRLFSLDDLEYLWIGMKTRPQELTSRYNLRLENSAHKISYSEIFSYYTEEQYISAFRYDPPEGTDWAITVTANRTKPRLATGWYDWVVSDAIHQRFLSPP